MACDPYWNNTVLALHFDGTNGSTTFTDECGNTVTANGNAQISTAQSKFGGASGAFDGTGDYLTVASTADLTMGASDFTIEGQVRFSTVSGVQVVYEKRASYAARGIAIYLDTDSKLYFSLGDSNTAGWEVSISSSVLSANTWYHFEFSRSGNSFRAFVDGTQVGSTVSSSITVDDGGGTLYIGDAIIGANGLNGYLDDFRITKGIARHTSNFTPPASAFVTNQCAISGVARDASNNLAQKLVRLYRRDTGALIGSTLSNATTGAYSIETSHTGEHFVVEHDATGDPYWGDVVLAMHMDDTALSDEKGNQITLYGGAARSATQSKFGGYSAYLDGTNDYITGPTISLGNNPFTVEFWYYPVSRSAYGTIISDGADYPFAIYHGSSVNSGNPRFACGPSNAAWFSNASGVSFGAVTDNVWVHLAVVRIGDTFKLFKDGTQVASGSTDSAGQSIPDFTLTLCNNNSHYVGCYIDDLRITKAARYTSSFTPDTSTFIHGPSGGSENADILDLLIPA